MDYLVISLITFGHISGSESDNFKSYQRPVIQMCKDGTVSGTSVYIETRETPIESVNCTCDVDLGGGTFNSVQYSGPGYFSCGIQFILGENNASFSCYSDTLSDSTSFSVIYFPKIVALPGYTCLSITSSINVTLTCHTRRVTTPGAPVSTSTYVSDSKSTTITTTATTSTTTTTTTTTTTIYTTTISMTRAGPLLSTGDTTQNKNSTCPCNQESTDITMSNQCSEGVSIAVVAGIIVGEAVIILLVHAVLWFLCCKRKDACSCLRQFLNRDEMKDNEAYGIVDISNISQGSMVILDTDYVNTDLNSRQNPDT